MNLTVKHWVKNRLDSYIDYYDHDHMLADYEDYLYWKGIPFLTRFEYICILHLYLDSIGWDIMCLSGESYAVFLHALRDEISHGNRSIIDVLKKFSSYMYRYGYCKRNYIRDAKEEVNYAIFYLGLYRTNRHFQSSYDVEYYYNQVKKRLSHIQ